MRPNDIFLIFATLAVLAFSQVNTARAQDEPVRSFAEVFFPFQYLDHDDRQRGFVTAIVKEVLATADQSTEIDFTTWTRAIKMAERIPNTLVFSMMRTPKREDRFHWIAPVARIPQAALFSAAERAMPTYEVLSDYTDHNVCAQEKTPPYDRLVEAGFEPGVNLFPLIDVAFSSMVLGDKAPVQRDWYELMLTDRCHYRVSIPVSMWARVRLSNRSALEITQHSDVPTGDGTRTLLYLVAHRDTNPQVLGAIKASYQTLRQSGRLLEICKREIPTYSQHCEIFEPQI